MARRTSRRMAATAGAVAAVCASTLAQPSANEALERIAFALGDVRYHIAMPKGSKLHDPHRPGCIEIWHPRSVRLMKFLELCAPARPAAATYRSHSTLSNGARVRYEVDHDIGSGMGGTEGELKGQLELEGRVLGLTCRDQSEWKTSPGWCLHYLRSLEVADRK
jgi:hypothetical protein